MKSLRTKAIVLKRTNYSEADRIIQLLTPTGKFSVIAKGVRREKSKMAGGIELFAICDVVIGESRGELGVLTSARLAEFFKNILSDYDRLQFGYHAINLIAKSSETIDSPDWFEILHQTLTGLGNLTIRLETVQTWFYLHYSAMLGHEFSLWNDINGNKMSSDLNYRYDIAEKGLRPTESGEITADHIKLLRIMATKPVKVVSQIGGIESIIGDCLMIARQHAAI